MMKRAFVKITALSLAVLLSLTMAGCVGATAASSPVTIKYWTWFPNEDQLKDAVADFEATNPDIKIELNIMESKAFQEKLPVALATKEDIDVVGVQPSTMVGQVKTYLADLDPLLKTESGDDWKSNLSEKDLNSCMMLLGGSGPLSIVPLFSSGAMIGYYNAAMLKEWGLTVPQTLEEYAAFADAVRAKDPSVLPAVYAGKEAWVNDEMMQNVMGQSSDYFNKFRYEKAPVDSQEFVDAMYGLKKFFDAGVFSMDIMDLDYGRAMEMFTTGKAATFYQGTWEAGILAESVRAEKGIALTDVGIMALPSVSGGTPTLRSFLDCTVGIVSYSKKQEAAAKWVAYLTYGKGVDFWAKHFCGTPSKTGFVMDDNLLGTEAEQQGFKLLKELVSTATADRNNIPGYNDIEGASVQRVVMGDAKAEDEVKELQKEWSSGKYGN